MSNVHCPICKGTGVYAPGNVVEKSTGTYWEDDKACPNCYPNEQETIFDRDVRAVVVAMIGLARHTPGIKWADLVTHSEAIALEMQKQRNKRKGLKHE